MLNKVAKNKASIPSQAVTIFICIALFLGGAALILINGKMPNRASLDVTPRAQAAIYDLPSPTALVPVSKAYSYPVLKGLKINPNDPFKLEFIIDNESEEDVSKEELDKLIKYFLAALTTPEEDLWVNLSPYEENRVISENLSFTDLGKDMLGQDYLLKQFFSSLTYPESEIGKKYWSKLYEEVYQLASTTNIPIDTFSKVWIVPDKAEVYENENLALITHASLKAMHEEDYLALKHTGDQDIRVSGDQGRRIHKVASGVMKEIILPEIEQDVNQGENFAKLRQMYHSLILATWFKEKVKKSVFQYYIDQGKVEGIDLEDKNAKEKVFNLYVQAYKKGVYNYIKSDYDSNMRQTIKRKYYSGGLQFGTVDIRSHQHHDEATDILEATDGTAEIRLDIVDGTMAASPAIRDTDDLKGRLKPANLGSGLARAIGSVTAETESREPIKLVHVSPKTLGGFAEKIQDGFEIIRERGLPIEARTIAAGDETADEFADRVAPQLKDADIVLLEVHGAEQEVRIMETIVTKDSRGKLIVLVHRPEEMVLRIKKEESATTTAAKEILADRLFRADAIVVLGESAINRYIDIFPNIPVVAILHPYFDAKDLPNTPNRYNKDSVVVVGSNTTWGEMRDIEDVEGLMQKISTRVKAVGYVAGKFQPAHIDMKKYIDRQNDDVIFLTNEAIVQTRVEGGFADEESFRDWLYVLSDEGRKLIIRAEITPGGDTFAKADFGDARLGEVRAWEGRVIDFNLQLYKENLGLLRDENQEAPKEEYSGTLHKGLAEIFLVLESSTMDDVGKGEGLRMIEVKSKTRRPDFSEAADTIIKLVHNPQERLGILRHNIQVAKSNGIENAAYGFFALSQYLLDSRISAPVKDSRGSSPVTSSARVADYQKRIPSASEFGVKAIVFDFGNVFNTFDYRNTANELNRRYGIDIERANDHFRERKTDRSHWMFLYDKGTISKTEAKNRFLQWVKDESGRGDIELIDEEFDSIIWTTWNEDIQEMYDLVSVVREKGYVVKIITTTNPTHYGFTVDKIAGLLANGSNDIYASHIMNFDKRQQDIYVRVSVEEGIRPDQMLFVDDVRENLHAAESVGLQVALFEDGKTESNVSEIVRILSQNFDSFLKGMRIPQVRAHLDALVTYMYGAYGVSAEDVKRMLGIIATSRTSAEAVQKVYDAGFVWNDSENKYGRKYRGYKTATDPDIRSDAIRQFVNGSVVFDIATGNTSMFNKVIGPMRNQITSARGSDIVVNEDQLREIQAKASENGIEFLPQSLAEPGKLPDGIDDHSVDTVTIIGALHHMTDDVRDSILREAHRILKLDGQLVVLEDTASANQPMTFPSGTYKEQVRQQLLSDFNKMSRENQNYIFALVDWMGNHLVPGDTSIPLSFNFKTREEWHEIFIKAGYDVQAEANLGVTPYKFHTHPELIFSLKPTPINPVSSPVQSVVHGGIDFDPANLNLNIEGNVYFNLPLETIRKFQTSTGMTFQILKIEKGVNLGNLLGAVDTE